MLDRVSLEFRDDYPPGMQCSGTLEFDNPDLAINNVSLSMGNSFFELNGSFKNILSFILLKKQKIQIRATIDNARIDLDQLLVIDANEDRTLRKYLISENLELDLACNINQLKFKRFLAKNMKGGVKVKDMKVFIQNMHFNSMGGELGFDGLINTKNGYLQITNSAELTNIKIDSVFYVFNNFGQDWLVKEHLKGNVYANVLLDLTFSPELEFYSDSLVADISISIRNGELNNFKPMIDLEKYVPDESLSKLRFSELQNDIHVENRIIYIPSMEVKSNVSSIQISGTHTFDQRINYQVVVPLKALGRNRNDERFGAVEETGEGSKLHLKIFGTTDSYEIAYDTKAVGKKIIADIKKEVRELKDAFKKKEAAIEQEVILNDEEFFEWDEEQDTIGYDLRIPSEIR